MEWRVDGNILIACSCDYGCPCNFNALPTGGKCEGGWIWIIERGDVDGIRLDNLAMALYADWPGAIHDGGGTAVCYIDDRATEQQRTALTRLIRGDAGGPWGIFRNTYTLQGPHAVPFDLQLRDYNTCVRIGDAVELELDTIRNPVTQAEVHPEVVLPEGLVTKHGKMARSKVFRIRGDDVAYDHSGQYAAFGRFSYASA